MLSSSLVFVYKNCWNSWVRVFSSLESFQRENTHTHANSWRRHTAVSHHSQFPRTRRSHPALGKRLSFSFLLVILHSHGGTHPNVLCRRRWKWVANGNSLDVFLMADKRKRKEPQIHQVIGRRLGICFRFRDVFFNILLCYRLSHNVIQCLQRHSDSARPDWGLRQQDYSNTGFQRSFQCNCWARGEKKSDVWIFL